MGGGRHQADAERDEPSSTSVPRWVTVSGLVAVLLLVVVVVLVLTGSGHGPGRHVSWAPQPAVPSTTSALAAPAAGGFR